MPILGVSPLHQINECAKFHRSRFITGTPTQARSQAWANPGSARVAQKTARVAQIVKMYEIDILTLEKAL